MENIVLAFLLVVIMLFTIPNAIIQNPKKRKMIGPGNQIKLKLLVDTTPAIAIRAPVTIGKIAIKDDPLFRETKNTAVVRATAPKPKIIPLTIELMGVIIMIFRFVITYLGHRSGRKKETERAG